MYVFSVHATIVDFNAAGWKHEVSAQLQVPAPALKELTCVFGQNTFCHGLAHAVVNFIVELLLTEVSLTRNCNFNLRHLRNLRRHPISIWVGSCIDELKFIQCENCLCFLWHPSPTLRLMAELCKSLFAQRHTWCLGTWGNVCVEHIVVELGGARRLGRAIAKSRTWVITIVDWHAEAEPLFVEEARG